MGAGYVRHARYISKDWGVAILVIDIELYNTKSKIAGVMLPALSNAG